MKKHEIVVGGLYVAKVAGKLTTVRVDAIREINGCHSIGENKYQPSTRYDVTNLATNRKTTFRSAAKFRGMAVSSKPMTQTDLLNQRNAEAIAKQKQGMAETAELHERVRRGELTAGQALQIKAGIPVETVTLDEDGNEVEDEQRSDPTSASNAVPAPVPTPASAPTPASSTGTTGTTTGLAAKLKASGVTTTTDDAPHLIVEARAGSGKTTTLVCALQVLMGQRPHVMVYIDPNNPALGKEPKYIEPSPQQQQVFDAVATSKGRVKTVCFVAFNKSIATELQDRVPKGVEAMTMHSMGFRAVRAAFPRVDAGDRGKWLVTDIVCELLGTDARTLRKDKFPLLKAVEDIVSKCKMNLTEPTIENLNDLVDYYDIELDKYSAQVFDLVPKVLERCKDVARNGRISFDDMIWLPVVLGLNVTKYDLLLVDEAQDLNRCQQTLAKMAGKRLVLCGDPKQAIYGFAGADAESMPRMHKELSSNGRGCQHLPLTVTRRCGKRIVAEANQYVHDFDAHESNPEGVIKDSVLRRKGSTEPDYAAKVQDGDFILCRVNAPLVSQCFRFLKMGRKANIQGRDVGQGLISTVNKLKASSITDLVAKLDDWLAHETAKERAKRMPSENRLVALQDRYDCLMCFTEGCVTVEDVTRKIDSVFTDNKQSPGIKLSSVHRAKGLESRRVHIILKSLREDKMQAWEVEQEDNLRYVAITRAIEELTFVTCEKDDNY